jgi:hypothetical protein
MSTATLDGGKTPSPGGHDSDLDRGGILLIALTGVLLVTAIVALIAGGAEWLAFLAVSVSVLSAAALMWLVGWLMGPPDDE